MAVKQVPHPTIEERRAPGKEAREQTPLSSHSGWVAASNRPDPVGLLEEQDADREPDLVGEQHGDPPRRPVRRPVDELAAAGSGQERGVLAVAAGGPLNRAAVGLLVGDVVVKGPIERRSTVVHPVGVVG